jgi:phenylacetaldehyde dehydrogenase
MATLPVHSRVSSPTADFIAQKHRMFIGGRFVFAASGKSFPVYNPATGEVMAHVPEADAEDVDRAVLAAREAFDHGPWPRMKPSERGKLLWKLGDLLEQHLEEFAELESLDNGKPVTVARAADVPLAVDMFRYMAGWATKISGSTLSLSFPGDYHSYTLREPVGVAAQIIPWNFPLLMAAWKLGPALAAAAPSSSSSPSRRRSPACALPNSFMKPASPRGVVNVLTGFGEGAGAPLAAHEQVDKVAFTGSTEVGGSSSRPPPETSRKSPSSSAARARPSSSPTPISTAPSPEWPAPSSSTRANAAAPDRASWSTNASTTRSSRESASIAGKIKVGPGSTPPPRWARWSATSSSAASPDTSSPASSRARRCSPEATDRRPRLLRPADRPRQDHARDEGRREEIFGPVVCAQSFTDSDLDRIAADANNTDFGLAPASGRAT